MIGQFSEKVSTHYFATEGKENRREKLLTRIEGSTSVSSKIKSPKEVVKWERYQDYLRQELRKHDEKFEKV